MAKKINLTKEQIEAAAKAGREKTEKAYAQKAQAIAKGYGTNSAKSKAGGNRGQLPGVSEVLARNNPAFAALQQAGNAKKLTKGSDAISYGKKSSERKPGQISALGAGDYGASKTTRFDATANAAIYSTAGAFSNLFGLLKEKDAQTKARDAADSARLKAGYDAMLNGEDINTREGGLKKQHEDSQKAFERGYAALAGAGQKNFDAADELAARSNEYQQMAKEGLGKFGQGVVDFGIAGLQFAGDAAMNAILPGSGLVAMGMRAAGSGAQEARNNGLDINDQFTAGLKSAAIEVLTEKLFGAASKVAYGKGIIRNESLVNSLVNRLAKTDKGRTALKVIAGANEEGLEEVLSDILNPIADRVLKLDDGKGDWSDLGEDMDAEQMLEDYIIGSTLGLFGAGTNVISGQYRAENAQQRAYENYQRELVNAGLASEQGSQTQLTAEEYQNILDNSAKRGNRNLSDKETANLEQLITAERDTPVVRNALERSGTLVDDNTASVIAKAASGQKLTRAEQSIIDSNPVMQQAVNTMSESGAVANIRTTAAKNSVVNSMAERYTVSPEVISRTYDLAPVESPEAFEMAFDAVYQMGQQGANKESLTKVPVLNRAQAEIAYNMGASTTQAAVDNAAVQSDSVSTQGNNQVSNAVNNTIQEVNNNGVRLRDSGQRLNGQNTEGQIPSVERDTVEAYAGTDSGRQSGYSAAQGKAGQKVVYNGVEQENVYYSGEDTESMKKGRELARSYGYNVTYFEGGNIKDSGGEFRGMVDTESKTVMVRSDHPDISAEQIMRHEMGHAAIAQGDISLDELRSAMLSDLSEEELNSAVEVYRHAYGDTISEAEAFEEMCCDALGKINIFAGTEHDSANYGKVQESFRKHTAETANKGRAPPKKGGEMYSREVNGKKIAWIENSPLTAKELHNHKKVAAYIANHIGEAYTIIESGSKVYLGESLPGEYTQSEYTKQILKNVPPILKAKNKAIGKLGEMIEIATNRRWEKAKHADNKDAEYGIYRYSTAFAFPVKQNSKVTNVKSFDAELIILNASDGKKYLYDIVSIKENTADEVDLFKKDQMRQNASARRGVSENSIRSSSENVNKKFSLEPVKPIQPKNGEWERGSTTDEVRAKHPDLWAVDAESSESRNPTQISGTVKSYRKIYDALKAEGFDGTVLDASSGLGYGTRAGIEEYGFNVEDIEPFPDSSYKPKYTDYSKLHKKYDVIISNAVLNVLPQDQRDALVVKMGQMLNDGCRMFINVRGTDVRNASSKVPINEANMEYYISNTGSYQKGFTKKELVAYLSDALGKDYTIVGTNKFGAVSAVVTKQAEVSKKFSREVKNAEEYFGTTYKVKEAGYICTDGKMLDFSGRHEGAPGGYRTVDHRDITDALGEDYGGEDYSGGMIKFMSEGNIRVSPESGGINLSVAPNKAQRSTLDRYISSFRGEVILDIDHTNGDTIASVEYPKYTHSSVVFKDIDDYFDKGKIPEKFSREPVSDSAYMKAVERGDTESAQRMVDEAAKKAGYTVKMYHGSKRGGGFTVFRDWSYFTKSKKYAQRYTERGNDKSLYSSYVKIENAFDTRKAADRYLFDEIRQEYGMGEIQDTGLPDWTDGYDIADYIDENGLNYDAIILDEGGDLVDGKPISRGLSYVIRNSNNIKSAEPITYDNNGNVIPLSERFKDNNPDIRYSREPERLNELRRQNRELKKRVDYWKGQTQRTKVKIVRQSDVNRLAREVIDMSESDLKPQDITERLSKLGEHILNEKELRYTDIAEMAQDIAEDVVSNATTIVNEDDVQTHNRLRGYLKRVKLKDDGSAEFESIRNSYKHRIMFNKNGMSVDSAYAELNSMFGEGYFPEDIINPADQLERIAEVLDGTAPQYANPNGYYAEEAAEYMRNYIIDSMLSDQVRQTAPTMADKAAAREAKLKADNAERIKNAVKKERERNEVKLQRFKEGVARLDSKRKETALKNRYRGQIEKNVNTLSKWLLSPDHKNTLKHIPGQLQSTVRDFISAIDFTSSQQLGGGAPTIKDMKYIDSLDRLRRYIADSKVGEDRYSDLDLPPEFETQLADFVSSVNTLARNNKGTYTINDMTSEQLKELSDIVKTMKKAITDMNRLYQNATFQHVYEAGESDIETLREYTKTKAFTSKLASNRLDQAIMWESSRPAHVFKRFGKGGESMYQEFVDGQNTMAFLTKEVIDFAEDTYTTAEVKQWAKETHEFKFSDQRVKLTSAQLMSLYELNKRSQAKQHLDSGGFRVANFKDGKFNLQTDKEKHVFTDTELNEMFGELTDRQKEVADKLQRFMVERGGEWGNYVSRKRFDVEMFKDENYFPIKIDTTETDSKVDEKTDNASLYQLLNMGFTKETSAKANQSIVVYDIFDVFANHMSEMAQYRSFALPLLDMTKWFNIKVRDEGGNVTASLRTEMRRAFGSDKNGRGFAEQFVTGIIKAYNGAEGRGDSSVNSRMINRVNRAAVAYNTRVMIQQPSAIVRAALYLDPKDLISSLKNYAGISTKQNIEEMHKHSGIALWKDLGFYDVNVSRGVQELIKHSQGTISKINEIGMKGAEFADKVTWAALWDASKKQVRRETGLSESDAEFFSKVSKVFENVIYNTQVVDTVLTKSEVSRNRSSGARLFTSFMSEPMTTASLVTSEIFDIQMKQAKGIKLKPSDYSRLSKTCIVVAVAAVVNSALASLADAWRDDDEYGTFGRKWTRAMRIKLADELNPLTYFPYASNVWDISKMLLDDADKKWFGVEVYGNGTDIPLTDIINSSLKALEIFREIREKGEDSKYTKFGGYYKVVNVLSKITGIPLYNIAREGVSLYNTFASDKIRSYEPSKEGAVKYAWNDGYLTDDEAIAALQDDAGMDEGEAWLEVEKWKNDTTSNYTKLYDAIDNGGDIKKAVDELTEHGVEEKNIKSSLTRRYKEAYINGDNKEREKIRRALYATGVYGSVNEVIEKCNSWLKK